LANLHQEEDKQITAMKHILEDIFQKPINVVHHKPIHEKMDNKILEFNIISLLHENGEMNYSNIYNHFSDANVTVRQLDSVLNALKDRGVLKLRAMSGNCGKKIRMYSIKRKVAAEKNPVTNNGISQELADRIKQLVCDELKKATDESEFDGKL